VARLLDNDDDDGGGGDGIIFCGFEQSNVILIGLLIFSISSLFERAVLQLISECL
jgi:hypothetical protein